MATIKSYTDINQSKKLAEFLPIESADMHYVLIDTDKNKYSAGFGKYIGILPHYPCWSLAALLNAVDFSTINLHYDNARTDWVASATIHDSTKHCTKYESTRAVNPIDACYEIILKLHELKML